MCKYIFVDNIMLSIDRSDVSFLRQSLHCFEFFCSENCRKCSVKNTRARVTFLNRFKKKNTHRPYTLTCICIFRNNRANKLVILTLVNIRNFTSLPVNVYSKMLSNRTLSFNNISETFNTFSF